MNEIQMKLKKTSKALSIILKIMIIFAIVIICGLVVTSVALPIFDANGMIDYSKFDFFDIVGSTNVSFGIAESAIISYIVATVCWTVILVSAQKIFSDTNKTSLPFTLQNAERIKIIAMAIIVESLVTPSLFIIIASILTPENDLRFNLGIEGLVMGFIIYALSLIFQYGFQLQKFSDETL